MQKNTFITGKQSSGKTTKAKEITNGKETVFLNNTEKIRELRFYLTEKTEFIVIDDIYEQSDLEDIVPLLQFPTIRFRQPYSKMLTEIQTPAIIAISNSISIAEASEILKEKFSYTEL